MKKQIKICKNCVMDTTDPDITFDGNGICNKCTEFYNKILPDWNYGLGKENELNKIIDNIKRSGKGKTYDCILGLSGGLDSSYLLHIAVTKLNLRPLIFHVDSGWDEPFAQENIRKIVNKLGLNIRIEKLNWDEMRNFQLAMFKAGVPDLDIPQDHAFVSALDKFAVENDIKYILNGGNISTEVIVNPSRWSYWGTDLVYIKHILNLYGKGNMKTYPFTNIYKRKIIVPIVYGVKTVKLLNYIPYKKKEAEEILMREYGWQPYPQKHFESILTKFIEGYWLPERFGYDIRKAQYSSLILTNQMTREEALDKLKEKPLSSIESNTLFEFVAKKLGVSNDELREYLTMPLKSYKDYKNQKKIIDLGARIMFWLKKDKLIRS